MKKLFLLLFCFTIGKSLQKKSIISPDYYPNWFDFENSGISPWTCWTNYRDTPNQCHLPFVEDGIQYKNCSATPHSDGNAWCPTQPNWSYGGQEAFDSLGGKDLGYGWDFCGEKGSGKEPFDCTYGKNMSHVYLSNRPPICSEAHVLSIFLL